MTETEISWVLGVLVLVYLCAVLIIAGRLKARYPETWRSAGSFSLVNWSVFSSLQIANFVLFRGAHRKLGDAKLSLLVYATRLLFACTILMLIGSKLFSY